MHESRNVHGNGWKAHQEVEPETCATAGLTREHPDGPTGVQLFEGEDAGLWVLRRGAHGSGDGLIRLSL